MITSKLKFNSITKRNYCKHKSTHEKLEKFINVQDDIKRGNLWEINQLKKVKDGKIFEGTEIAKEVQLKWPDKLKSPRSLFFEKYDFASTLKSSPLNFVLVSQKRIITTSQCKSWVNEFHSSFPDIPIYDITILNNLFYRYLNPILAYSWESKIKNVEYIYCYETIPVSQKELGIDVENSFLNYQFLVDNQLNIRWKSVGLANEKDLENLKKTTQRILEKEK